MASTKRDPAFLSKGFTYWKEATSSFKKHQASGCDHEATEALIVLPKQIHDVGEALCKEHEEEKAVNRKILHILRNVRFQYGLD